MGNRALCHAYRRIVQKDNNYFVKVFDRPRTLKLELNVYKYTSNHYQINKQTNGPIKQKKQHV